MTDLSSIPPIAATDPPIATKSKPAPVSAPEATRQTQQPSPVPTHSVTTGMALPAGTGSGVPFQLNYDLETQRFILEARDPKTGAVIIQLPPQTAFEQIQATASAATNPPVGGSVDKTA